MLTDEELLGIKKKDLAEAKVIKVRLPVRFLINLHFLKITGRKDISQVVSEALEAYFRSLSLPTILETHPVEA